MRPNSRRMLLTGPGFAAVGAWQLLGLLGFFSPIYLYAYMALLPLLAAVMFWDHASLPRLGESYLKLKGPELVELGVIQPFELTLVAGVAATRPASSFSVELPEWPLLHAFADANDQVGASAGRGRALSLQVAGRQLGLQELGEARCSLSSRLRWWRSFDSLAISGVPIRVVASAQNARDSAYKGSSQIKGVC